jgi:hypothetical protein
MNKPEWMPTNDEIIEAIKKIADSTPDRDIIYALKLSHALSDAAQTKLLEYLREQMLWIPLQTLKIKPTEDAPFTGHLKIGEPLRAMNQSTLESMLKEIQENGK